MLLNRFFGFLGIVLMLSSFSTAPAFADRHPVESLVSVAQQQGVVRSSVIRVMALGDSITAGVGAYGSFSDDGGYRGSLAKLLVENGYHVTFVGSRSDFSVGVDAAHEGWPGYVLRSFPSDPGPGQLYGNLVRDAIEGGKPDLILLMAGTNDLLRLEKGDDGYTLGNIVQSMDLILDEIFQQNPHVRVILAPVVSSPLIDICTLAHFDGTDMVCGPMAVDNLANLVGKYSQRGYQITLAGSMANAVPRDSAHFPDGIHPSGAGGYAAVANTWYQAISDVTDESRRSVY
jgi:lysophospholipase L1-like esterase